MRINITYLVLRLLFGYMDSLGVTLTLIIYDSSLLAADTNNGERERERERDLSVFGRLSPLCVPFH